MNPRYEADQIVRLRQYDEVGKVSSTSYLTQEQAIQVYETLSDLMLEGIIGQLNNQEKDNDPSKN